MYEDKRMSENSDGGVIIPYNTGGGGCPVTNESVFRKKIYIYIMRKYFFLKNYSWKSLLQNSVETKVDIMHIVFQKNFFKLNTFYVLQLLLNTVSQNFSAASFYMGENEKVITSK